MRNLAVLFLHLLATVARLVGPGGARSVMVESLLVKQHLLILKGRGSSHPRRAAPFTRLRMRGVGPVARLD